MGQRAAWVNTGWSTPTGCASRCGAELAAEADAAAPHAAIKPAALPSWFRLSLARWKAAVSSAADTAALLEAIAIFGAACRSEEPPAPDWAVKTEHPPAMPEGCVVVKTEVKTEAKQEVPAWPDDAYVEARVKQEVAQQLAPVVRQGAAGSSSGTTKMQAAPHMRRRPVSPGEASNEESAAPGSAKEGCAKRARTSSSARQVQPDSVGAHGEAAGALG